MLVMIAGTARRIHLCGRQLLLRFFVTVFGEVFFCIENLSNEKPSANKWF